MAATSPGISALLKAALRPVNTAGLTKVARANASADTGTALAAIRAQQQTDQDAAAGRARSINDAALAASKYVGGLNLGGALSDSLRQAAGDQATLASGFSGQLRDTVGTETSKVNDALRALGAPGAVPNTSAEAGNVVYGVGGQLPANALLAAAPFAKAQADEIPAQLLGYGNSQAAGALGAGKAQAAALEPQLVAAIGKQPQLERSYLSQLETSAAKSHESAVGDLYKAVSAQQRGDAQTATASYHQAEIDQRKADAEQRAAEQAATATERTRHDQATEAAANRRNEISARKATTSTAKPIIYGSDKAGRYALNPATGKVEQLTPPVTSKPTGQSTRPLTASQRKTATATLTQALSIMRDGGADKTGNPIPSLSRADALKELESEGYLSSPQYRKLAVALLNRIYGPVEQKIASGAAAGPPVPSGLRAGGV